MLAKKERLTTSAFDRSFSLGRRFHFPTLTIVYDGSTTEFHGAVVVGKKVYKQAVKRNRLRRQVYGALYRWTQQHTVPGTFIILTKPALRDVPQRAVSQTVSAALDDVANRLVQSPRP